MYGLCLRGKYLLLLAILACTAAAAAETGDLVSDGAGVAASWPSTATLLTADEPAPGRGAPLVTPQPPKGPPAPSPRENTPPAPPPNENDLAFLAPRAPNIFGHDLMRGLTVVATNGYIPYEPTESHADLPLAGGCGRLNIADNNNALPQDRIYFLYNHFQNAITAEGIGRAGFGTEASSLPLDRYTFGIEKTFGSGLYSVEVRMPLAGESWPSGVSGNGTGNLSVVLKTVLRKTDSGVLSAGLGVETPTGGNVTFDSADLHFRVRNEAVFLVPYAGLYVAPESGLFFHGFLQCNVPLTGNPIDGADYQGAFSLGSLSEQTLLQLDCAFGYWLIRDPQAHLLKRLAPVIEVHETSTLQDSAVRQRVYFDRSYRFGNAANRVDIVDLTLGLHAELAGNWFCRVGGVVPLSAGDNRGFDSEVLVQVEKQF